MRSSIAIAPVQASRAGTDKRWNLCWALPAGVDVSILLFELIGALADFAVVWGFFPMDLRGTDPKRRTADSMMGGQRQNYREHNEQDAIRAGDCR